MSDSEQRHEQAASDGGNLAPVALSLGIAGLVMGLIPFYGSMFALPLSIIALVLGLTARNRPGQHHRREVVDVGLTVTCS